MASQEEIKELAHKITLEQLAEAERIKSAYQEPNPDRKSPFTTMGEVYAHNYLQTIANSKEKRGYNRPSDYKTAKSLGVVCPQCSCEKLRQYRGRRDHYYWECKNCFHQFKSPR
jgi:hypothetical protein